MDQLIPKKLSEEERARLVKQWKEKYSGPDCSMRTPPSRPQIDLDDTYDIDRRRKLWRKMFDSDEEMEQWDNSSPQERRRLLENEWNAKQDHVSYFWKIVVAIAVGLLLFLFLR